MSLAVLCINVMAQKIVEESVPLNQSQGITLDLDFADNIVFKIWDKNEVKVNVSVNINNNENNDSYTLHVDESSAGNVKFKEEIKDMKKLQKSQQVYDKDGNELYTSCTIDLDIIYEVTVPQNTSISLKTISGDIEADGLLGNLDLQSISGDIDFTFPVKGKADLMLKTISGEMYSDFEFQKTDKEREFKHHYIRSKFQYELNGGGDEIELSTISGNIYFRKQ
jgi:hypothetical protein